MIELTYEQKFAAILALGEAQICMRKPGDWYVSQSGVDITNGSMLEGRYGNGASPERAIEDHWMQLTILKGGEVIAIDTMAGSRRYVRWTGFMWSDVPRDLVERDRG